MNKIILILYFIIHYQVAMAGNGNDILTGQNRNYYTIGNNSGFTQRPELDKGIFLIAGTNLKDPNFNKAVILITGFDMTGTTGLIINKPTDILIQEVLPQFSEFDSLADNLNIGGPVATHTLSLLVRSETELEPSISLHIFDNVYLINTLDTLQSITSNNGSYFRLYAGYSGWAPGQLESEILRGDWHIWHADSELIFDNSNTDLWQNLIELVKARWVFIGY